MYFSFFLIGLIELTIARGPFRIPKKSAGQGLVEIYEYETSSTNIPIAYGVMISSHTVVTTAMSLFDKAWNVRIQSQSLMVSCGSAERIRVVNIIFHPEFWVPVARNDIAILLLEKEPPMCRTFPIAETEENPGEKCSILYSNENGIEKGNVTIYSLQFCIHQSQPLINQYSRDLICSSTVPRDVDSVGYGRPLICNGIVFGLESRHYNCHSKGNLALFTKLTAYEDFIQHPKIYIQEMAKRSNAPNKIFNSLLLVLVGSAIILNTISKL